MAWIRGLALENLEVVGSKVQDGKVYVPSNATEERSRRPGVCGTRLGSERATPTC